MVPLERLSWLLNFDKGSPHVSGIPCICVWKSEMHLQKEPSRADDFQIPSGNVASIPYTGAFIFWPLKSFCTPCGGICWLTQNRRVVFLCQLHCVVRHRSPRQRHCVQRRERPIRTTDLPADSFRRKLTGSGCCQERVRNSTSVK